MEKSHILIVVVVVAVGVIVIVVVVAAAGIVLDVVAVAHNEDAGTKQKTMSTWINSNLKNSNLLDKSQDYR